MLYEDLKLYLQTNLPRPSLDFIWNDEYNEKFFNYITEKFPQENLEDKENSYIIKQVFKDYFANIGYLLFKLNEKSIKFKIFPYKIEPKDSVNLDSIVDIIDNNENLITFDYKGKSNQILIKKELVANINNFAYEITMKI